MLALKMIHHLILPREPVGAFSRTARRRTVEVPRARSVLLHVSVEVGSTLELARTTWVEANMPNVICNGARGGTVMVKGRRRRGADDVTVGIECRREMLYVRNRCSGTVGSGRKRGRSDAVDGDVTVGTGCRPERLCALDGRIVTIRSGC